MTMPFERTRSVPQTLDFLRELTDPELTPDVPKNIRDQAKTLLRHYPSAAAMNIVALACPRWFGPLESTSLAQGAVEGLEDLAAGHVLDEPDLDRAISAPTTPGKRV